MTEIMKEIGERWRGWLHGVVGWWRRITGCDRYYMGYDPACSNGDKAARCICRVDSKTGVVTVLESGQGEPPANVELSDSRPKQPTT